VPALPDTARPGIRTRAPLQGFLGVFDSRDFATEGGDRERNALSPGVLTRAVHTQGIACRHSHA